MDDIEREKIKKKITGIIQFQRKVATQIENKLTELENLQKQQTQAEGRLEAALEIFECLTGDKYDKT